MTITRECSPILQDAAAQRAINTPPCWGELCSPAPDTARNRRKQAKKQKIFPERTCFFFAVCYNGQTLYEGVACADTCVASQHPCPLCGLACFNLRDSCKPWCYTWSLYICVILTLSMALSCTQGFFSNSLGRKSAANRLSTNYTSINSGGSILCFYNSFC